MLFLLLQVDMRIMQCQADLQEAKTNLRKHLGQLVYLQNLAKVSWPSPFTQSGQPCRERKRERVGEWKRERGWAREAGERERCTNHEHKFFFPLP